MVINKLTKNIIGKVFEVLTFQERRVSVNFVFSQKNLWCDWRLGVYGCDYSKSQTDNKSTISSISGTVSKCVSNYKTTVGAIARYVVHTWQ